MAMSNLYSKIAPKPVKRIQDNMPVSQTNAWMNGKLLHQGDDPTYHDTKTTQF